MSRVVLAVCVALACACGSACGGEPGAEPRPARTAGSGEAAPEEPPPPTDEPALAELRRADPAAVASAPDFDAPMPESACPDAVHVALGHQSAALPPELAHAIALRSEDGRHIRVLVASQPLERDELGRFAPPTAGNARFEMDLVRRRRGALAPGVLGAPDSSRAALTHVRVVRPGPILTFGHRDIGRVELTHADPTRVCARVDLDDGFTRVRGAISAPVRGPVPR